MEVICKGYKTCEHNTWCHHAKPHKYDDVSDNYCFNEDDSPITECYCNEKNIRKYKLEKLSNL